MHSCLMSARQSLHWMQVWRQPHLLYGHADMADTASSACLQGQLCAIWRHRLSRADLASIKSSRAPVLVMHGRWAPCLDVGDQLTAENRWPEDSNPVLRCQSAPCADLVQRSTHSTCCTARYDILAMPRYGERLASTLECPLVMLEGGHFLNRERGVEVNLILHHVIWRAGTAIGVEGRYLHRSKDWPVRESKANQQTPPSQRLEATDVLLLH